MKRGHKTLFILLAPYHPALAEEASAIDMLGLRVREVPKCWYGHGTTGYVLWNKTNVDACDIAARIDFDQHVYRVPTALHPKELHNG